MAGSVIPKIPVSPAENATFLISLFFVLMNTPRQAAACATTAQV